MPTESQERQGSRRPHGDAVCPYCGQTLQDQDARQHLIASERKHERQLHDAAVEHQMSAHREQVVEEQAKHGVVLP